MCPNKGFISIADALNESVAKRNLPSVSRWRSVIAAISRRKALGFMRNSSPAWTQRSSTPGLFRTTDTELRPHREPRTRQRKWRCSEKQRNLILRLIEAEVEAKALSQFQGKGVKQLNKIEAGGLIIPA